jgi:hypothetical protein
MALGGIDTSGWSGKQVIFRCVRPKDISGPSIKA